jgi:hypothetical protein
MSAKLHEICHKCKKIYIINKCRSFIYSKRDNQFAKYKGYDALICNNCYTLIAICCNKTSLTDRCTIVRNYSTETNDIRDTMKIIRKLGVGKGGLKPGFSLFINKILNKLFIPPVVSSIYEYLNEKEIHIDILTEYYKSNIWYCNRCGDKHKLHSGEYRQSVEEVKCVIS